MNLWNMNTKIQPRKLNIAVSNFQTQEIPHNYIYWFVSIFHIFKYLKYFSVLFTNILLATKLQIEILLWDVVIHHSSHWTSRFKISWSYKLILLISAPLTITIITMPYSKAACTSKFRDADHTTSMSSSLSNIFDRAWASANRSGSPQQVAMKG